MYRIIDRLYAHYTYIYVCITESFAVPHKSAQACTLTILQFSQVEQEDAGPQERRRGALPVDGAEELLGGNPERLQILVLPFPENGGQGCHRVLRLGGTSAQAPPAPPLPSRKEQAADVSQPPRHPRTASWLASGRRHTRSRRLAQQPGSQMGAKKKVRTLRMLRSEGSPRSS